jgi:hypothetical protein
MYNEMKSRICLADMNTNPNLTFTMLYVSSGSY